MTHCPWRENQLPRFLKPTEGKELFTLERGEGRLRERVRETGRRERGRWGKEREG